MLAEAFPVIRKLLGDNNFNILAGQFVRTHPPTSPLIAFYGEALPEFLEGFELVRSLGYLPDIARLELALRSKPLSKSKFAEASIYVTLPRRVLPLPNAWVVNLQRTRLLSRRWGPSHRSAPPPWP